MLLSDGGVEDAPITDFGLPAVESAPRQRSLSAIWLVAGFCIAGLLCAPFVPGSYLSSEQTSTLIAQAPLS